jgi:hypothetical protein
MFNRSKLSFKNYLKTKNENLVRDFKYRCVTCVFMQRIEYAQTISGRCTSIRSKGVVKSIVVRNKKYGIETRFILNNPRLVIFK